MTAEEIIGESHRYLMNTYARLPVVIVRGEGMRVYDPRGKEYLDFVGGVGAVILGHSHPRLVASIGEQAGRLIQISNLFYSEPQVRLARMLVKHFCAGRVFFSNSGAEAVEAAIKLARRHAKERGGPGRYEILTMHNSFHGRTIATISATAQERFQKGFEPLLPGFRYVPFNDIPSVVSAITERTAAILVEPIQGEGGVNVPDANYLRELRKICDAHKLLLILDEVQTGVGRTGRLFAYEHSGISPDIVALAKGLGGGVPIGATLARSEVAEGFAPGSHASTFGGNPLACAVACVTLQILVEEGILEQCRQMGHYFRSRLLQLKERHPCIREVRGEGLLLGVELTCDGRKIVQHALSEGFLINCTMERVLRFLPPLIITRAEIDALIGALDRIFSQITNGQRL